MGEESREPDFGPLDPAGRRVGSQLDGKWRLDRVLGVGGMAAVYAATHRNGARAAIKLFPFSVTTSVEFAERILREGVLANKIGHPAVVRVLDDHLDREREYAYLVMELLEGETARQRIERHGPMAPLEAIDHMIELCECLGAAHAKGVVHRDIKPENLFLTTEGKLKVLDFGVARALDGTSSTVTRTGAMLGTPAYMSPEQARGRPSEISPRSDLYSVGATLLFLLAGDFMHEGESAQEIMVRAAWTPARRVVERGLGLPESLARVIDRACEFDAEDRYDSAREMRDVLLEVKSEIALRPESNRPITRVVRLPQANTAPLELSSRPREPVFETMSDDTPIPAEGTSIRRVTALATPRRRLVAAAIGVALVAVLGFVWGKSEQKSDAPAPSPHDVGSAAPVVAAPTPVPQPVAPSPAPSIAPPVEVASALAEPPPTPSPATANGAHPNTRRTHGGHGVHAPVPHAVLSETPAANAPTNATTATAQPTATRVNPSKANVGRDVGY
ncbi:MAG TPA: serine/threonine-protein kinase [Polyangiaceae bacterium]|jgi:serine/threonine-protein kinase|nr:serine/threonine-protein kinase [Polyangiaceae bacterium]